MTHTEYQGYLEPWLPDISRLWETGHTTKEIARIILGVIREHPEKLPVQYTRGGVIPLPTPSMIRYVLECTGHGPVERQWHPHDYPTGARWRLILSPDLAHKQARWERLRAIRDMQKLGFTLEQIGRRIKLSRERVRQLTIKPLPQYSPLELFLQDEKIHLRELAKSSRLLAIVTIERAFTLS